MSPEKRSRPHSPDTRSPTRRRSPLTPERKLSTMAATVPPPAGPSENRFAAFGNVRPPSGPRSERFPPTGPGQTSIPSGPRSLTINPHATLPVRPAPPTPSIQKLPAPTDTTSLPPLPGGLSQSRKSWSERSINTPIADVQRAQEMVPAPAEVVQEPPPIPMPSEAELAEQRAREEGARIMAELPALKVGFGKAAWETELDNHYERMVGLQKATSRAQSAQRVAGAVLADAEAERIAAMERRKVAESQLGTGTLGMGLIGGV